MLVVENEVYRLTEPVEDKNYAMVVYPTGKDGLDLYIVDVVLCDFDCEYDGVEFSEMCLPLEVSYFKERVKVNGYHSC